MNHDREEFEARLREERQSAARSIELLTMAQSTLAGAFQRMREEQAGLDAALARSATRVTTPEPEATPAAADPKAESVAVGA